MNEFRYPEIEILDEPFKKMQEDMDAAAARKKIDTAQATEQNEENKKKKVKETKWSFDGTNITIEFKKTGIDFMFKCHDNDDKNKKSA